MRSRHLPAPRRREGRLSDLALWALGTGYVLVALTVLRARHSPPGTAERLLRNQQLVSNLQLTDLCLNTEGRYTRHISQADLFSAFQDVPMSLEHMPSGSVLSPVRRSVPWRRHHPPRLEVKR